MNSDHEKIRELNRIIDGNSKLVLNMFQQINKLTNENKKLRLDLKKLTHINAGRV